MPRYWPSFNIEEMQQFGGPYYDPYSPAPINLGLALRQNLAQIIERKRREQEEQAARDRERFERWLKEQELKLKEEDFRAKLLNMFSSKEKPSAYSPEARKVFEQQLGLPTGSLETAPDTAITDALNELMIRGRPERPEKTEKKPEKDELLESMKTAYNWFKEVKKDLDNEANNAHLMTFKELADFKQRQYNYKRNEIFVRGILAKYEINKKKPNPREMRFFEEIMKNPFADINDILLGLGNNVSTSAPQASPGNEVRQETSAPPGPLVGYDKNGNPLYRGPDGRLYRRQ